MDQKLALEYKKYRLSVIVIVLSFVAGMWTLYNWLYQYSLNVGPYFNMSYYNGYVCKNESSCDLSGTFSVTNNSNDYLAFRPYQANIYLVKADTSVVTLDLSVTNLVRLKNKLVESDRVDVDITEKEIVHKHLVIERFYSTYLCTSNQVDEGLCLTGYAPVTSKQDDVIFPEATSGRVLKLIVNNPKLKTEKGFQKYLLTEIIVNQSEVKLKECTFICSAIQWGNDQLLGIFFGKSSLSGLDQETVFYDLWRINNMKGKKIVDNQCERYKNTSGKELLYCSEK